MIFNKFKKLKKFKIFKTFKIFKKFNKKTIRMAKVVAPVNITFFTIPNSSFTIHLYYGLV